MKKGNCNKSSLIKTNDIYANQYKLFTLYIYSTNCSKITIYHCLVSTLKCHSALGVLISRWSVMRYFVRQTIYDSSCNKPAAENAVPVLPPKLISNPQVNILKGFLRAEIRAVCFTVVAYTEITQNYSWHGTKLDFVFANFVKHKKSSTSQS